jgi:hypothetical protein
VAKSTASRLLALLAGHFESLRNLPANGQLDVAVDADVNNHWTIFNRESFVDLAEIVGPIDSEALGAKTDGQFFEIGRCDFRVFRRQALVDEVVPLLPNGVVVEHEHGERQIVTDRGVEI